MAICDCVGLVQGRGLSRLVTKDAPFRTPWTSAQVVRGRGRWRNRTVSLPGAHQPRGAVGGWGASIPARMPTPFRRLLPAALAACLLSGAPLRAQGGGVLVASAVARQVQWLDASAGQTRRITSVRGRPGRVAPFGGGVWAAVALDAVGAPVPSVAIFDGRTGRLLRDVPLVAADGQELGAVTALVAEPGSGGAGCLLATEASSFLYRLGADGSLEAVADLGEPGVTALDSGAREGTLLALLRAQGALAEFSSRSGRARACSASLRNEPAPGSPTPRLARRAPWTWSASSAPLSSGWGPLPRTSPSAPTDARCS